MAVLGRVAWRNIIFGPDLTLSGEMQGESYADKAGSLESLHGCAKVWSCVAATVEGWCTLDEEKGQVEMSEQSDRLRCLAF